MESKKKLRLKMPNPYVLLFGLVLIAAILTFIIPSGSYLRETVEGLMRPVIVPDTFELQEKIPIKFIQIFSAVPIGMADSASIIFLIFLSTGAFTIYNKSGAIENGIGVLLQKIQKAKINKYIVLWLITFLFSAFGWVSGPEMHIPFVPIAISISLGLGFDLVVGLALLLAGSGIGFAMAPNNASIIGTSHSILGMPIFSGFGFRTLLWLVATIVVCMVITWYARRIEKSPEKSYVHGISTEGLGLSKELGSYKLTGKQVMVLLIFIGCSALSVFGSLQYGWYLAEMAGTFLIGGISAGLVSKMSLDDIAGSFVKGASSVASVALLVGLARAIQVVLEAGNIMDTIIYYISQPLSALSPGFAAIAISIITAFLHIFITSGSGLAVTIMPIIGPLGPIVGLTLQSTVLAFQIGSTVTNMILPTLGATMAMCGIAKVPFEKWFKLGIKIVAAIYVVSWIFLLIAVAIGYGPM